MIEIRQITEPEQALIPPLCELLIDAVHNGASVGFLAPLSIDRATRYWEQVVASLGEGLLLWVAETDGRIVGSVQLAPSQKENGRHRAELQKLFVHSAFRGQGISTQLMSAAETAARAAGCTLLVLDTLAGSGAEAVYQHLGWQRAGEIPNFAASPDGQLHATVYYFKSLAPESVGAPASAFDSTNPIRPIKWRLTMAESNVKGLGTKETPWQLTTPSGSSEYQMYRDQAANPPALVCLVGKTELRYHLRCIEDLHAMLQAHGDWMLLGSADEQRPVAPGTVEAWGRSADNPVGGWYGLKKGLRGRFGMYLPPLLEALGLAEVEHNPKNNRMRAL